MSRLLACLVLALPCLALGDDKVPPKPKKPEGPLAEAKQRWLRGNYVEAQDRYEKLTGDDKVGVDAVVGVSRCLESQGEYDKALEVVEKLQKTKPKDVKLWARQAEVLYLRGRWDDAMNAAEQAIEASPDNFAARWVRAQLYRDRGEIKKADGEFRWFGDCTP